jgi:hypothetical protein
MNEPADGPWQRWMGSVRADLSTVACLLAIGSLARGFCLWWDRGAIADATPWTAVVQALVSGCRLDMRAVVVLVAPAFALGLLRLHPAERPWIGRFRRGWRIGAIAVIAATAPLATAIDLAYLGEYGHRFDATLFAAGADDPAAIAASIWQGWPVLRILAVAILLGAALAWCGIAAARPRVETLRWRPSRPWRIVLGIGLLVCIIGLSRGSLTAQPWNMRVAASGVDPALDRQVPAPWKLLHRAWIDHRRLHKQDGVGSFIPDGDVRAAAARIWGDAADLDAATARIAAGGRAPAPRHVVLVVLESYGAWALDPAWRELGLAEGMRALAAEGQMTTRFISAGDQTMKSFGAIVSGLPYAGIELPDLPSSRSPYPSSLPAAFRRMGYRTRLFYAGYSSWQRIADLMRDQGFDEVVCGGALGLDPAVHNEWGLPDEPFLDRVRDRLDPAQPTLDVILTVGNHVPFDADVRAAGWSMEAPPASLAAACDDTFDARVLGHFWLMDRRFARFAREAAERLPGLLLAATGDHYGRRYPDRHPDLPSRTLVPFLLWGPGLDRRLPAGCAGSHIDIAPTLIERCAPAGFAYHAFGRDLLGGDPGCGIGQTAAVTADAVVDLVAGGTDEADLRRRADDLRGLGWWRAMRGPAWPSPAPSSR